MNKHLLQQMNFEHIHIKTLTINSYEMGIYLVEADLDDDNGIVVDGDGHPVKFHSVEEVKNSFDNCRIDKAVLVHESAYDEMCGGPEKGENRLEVPVIMHQHEH